MDTTFKNITCFKCGCLMNKITSPNPSFKKNNSINHLHYYECPNGHIPRRVFYSNGKEKKFLKKKCPYCNNELDAKIHEFNKRLELKDKCTYCSYEQKEIFEIKNMDFIEFKELIDIESSDFVKLKEAILNIKHLDEDIDNILKLEKILDSKKEFDTYNTEQIKVIKVPHLKKLLKKPIKKLGYTKFFMNSPNTTPFITIQFSLQDPKDRTEHESKKELKKIINKTLLYTNWRLMSQDILYKLGVLSGKLRAYTDLIYIAKDIEKKIF